MFRLIALVVAVVWLRSEREKRSELQEATRSAYFRLAKFLAKVKDNNNLTEDDKVTVESILVDLKQGSGHIDVIQQLRELLGVDGSSQN